LSCNNVGWLDDDDEEEDEDGIIAGTDTVEDDDDEEAWVAREICSSSDNDEWVCSITVDVRKHPVKNVRKRSKTCCKHGRDIDFFREEEFRCWSLVVVFPIILLLVSP